MQTEGVDKENVNEVVDKETIKEVVDNIEFNHSDSVQVKKKPTSFICCYFFQHVVRRKVTRLGMF